MLKKTFATYKAQLEKGEILQVIEGFYADDIAQVENNDAPIVGKTILTEMEIKNLAGVHSVEIKIPTYLVDEAQGMAMGEMVIHFDSKKSGKQVLTEAFLQHWKEEKIVFQKFYYK
jgi:hypothetical protein